MNKIKATDVFLDIICHSVTSNRDKDLMSMESLSVCKKQPVCSLERVSYDGCSNGLGLRADRKQTEQTNEYISNHVPA